MVSTEDAARLLNTRMAMGMLMELKTVARMLQITKKAKETMHTVLRPAVLEERRPLEGAEGAENPRRNWCQNVDNGIKETHSALEV